MYDVHLAARKPEAFLNKYIIELSDLLLQFYKEIASCEKSVKEEVAFIDGEKVVPKPW